MRHVLTAGCLLATAAMGWAQNEFMIWPERNGSSATFTQRTSTQQVEQFMEVDPRVFAGVGDSGGACLVWGLFHWASDENATTQESFHAVFRKAATGGGPDTSSAGLLLRVGPFNLPTGTGRVGWKITTTLQRPLQVPCRGGFLYGLEHTPANWPSDGHSIWNAYYSPPASRGVGDNPRPNAPQHAWSNLQGAPQSHAWVWRMGVLVRSPILNPGGIDPSNARQSPTGSSNYAAGGLYPDISGPRRDGLDMRVESTVHPNSPAVVLIGVQFSPVPLPVGTAGGRLQLTPALLLVLGAGLSDTQGVAVVPIAPPNVLPVSLVGQTFHFQAATIASGQISLTNGAAVSY